MKRWEMILLALLICCLLAGAIRNDGPADTLPAKQVYSWWGVVYPSAATPEVRDDETYILKFRTAELWQQLCEWIRSGTA